MQKIRTLIVDDEPHALEVIAGYLQRFPGMELAGSCSDAIQAFQVLQQRPVDLLFLDIYMPGLTGIELLRSLSHPPKVIFTTAHMEHAVDGFELDAVDYLLKPISFDRFLRAVDKFVKLQQGIKPVTLTTTIAPAASQSVFIYLKVERRMVKLNTADILWIESLKDYIKVVTPERTFTSKQKISVIEELLPADAFMRVHRSFIVGIARIDSFYSHCLEIGGKEIPIGRIYKADVGRRLRQ